MTCSSPPTLLNGMIGRAAPSRSHVASQSAQPPRVIAQGGEAATKLTSGAGSPFLPFTVLLVGEFEHFVDIAIGRFASGARRLHMSPDCVEAIADDGHIHAVARRRHRGKNGPG